MCNCVKKNKEKTTTMKPYGVNSSLKSTKPTTTLKRTKKKSIRKTTELYATKNPAKPRTTTLKQEKDKILDESQNKKINYSALVSEKDIVIKGNGEMTADRFGNDNSGYFKVFILKKT